MCDVVNTTDKGKMNRMIGSFLCTPGDEANLKPNNITLVPELLPPACCRLTDNQNELAKKGGEGHNRDRA